MSYTKEQYDQLPEFMQNDLVEVDGDYKHAGVVKMKASLNELDTKFKTTEGSLTEVNTRLATIEASKQAEIEEARAQGLAEAVTKGDAAAVEARYKEQAEDLKTRVAAETRESVTKEFTFENAKVQATSQLSEIVAGLKPLDDEASQLMTVALRARQQVAENGDILYLNEDGSASSLDKVSLLADLQKTGKFERLRQAYVPTTGGGYAKGSQGGSANNGGQNKLVETAKKKGDSVGLLSARLGENLNK
jgi:glucan-binding YG repeat protein